MRVLGVAAAVFLAGSLMPALAQDKSREVVGSDAKPLAYPHAGAPELTMMALTMQPDGHTSLHKHPSPTAGFVMEGLVEVRSENIVLKVKAGEGFLEPIDGPMQIWNTNTGVSKLVIFVVGTEGTPVAMPVK
jgi:quercetin dioxygenase-like cupin family protein